MTSDRFEINAIPDSLMRDGPIIPVQIGFDQEFAVYGAGSPNLPPRRHLALVDTGAWDTCIDYNLATELELPVVGNASVAGAHGVAETSVYAVHVHIPELSYTIVGQFAGVDLSVGGQNLSALIGRTFLRNFTMTYEGRTGTVTISND